jgi:SET domain-containing protein
MADRSSKAQISGGEAAYSVDALRTTRSTLAILRDVPLSYRSPKTEIRASKIHGRGLFATTDISKDEVVAVKGGHIVDQRTLREKITPRLGPVEIQIDDDLFIAPVTKEERELSMLYSNHSCDANLGVRSGITFVAMRDIRTGEELTLDWAMTDDDDYSVECKCGAANCRKILSGKDWQRPELQKRYAGYFSSYLAEKIARQAMLHR